MFNGQTQLNKHSVSTVDPIFNSKEIRKIIFAAMVVYFENFDHLNVSVNSLSFHTKLCYYFILYSQGAFGCYSFNRM